MRCFNLGSDASARNKAMRLQRDHLIEKYEDFVENGKLKSKFRKTGTLML